MKELITKDKKIILGALWTCLIQVIAMIFLEIKKGALISSVFELDVSSLFKEFMWLILLVVIMLGFGFIYATQRIRFVQEVTYDLRKKFFHSFFNCDIKGQF